MTCPECGERSAAGVQFCGRCGTFLEWDADEAPATPTQAPAADTGAPAPVVRRPDEAPRRVAPTRPEEPPRLAPGEVPCRSCGAGNDPTRRFCRACGVALAEDTPAVRLPWWRRLLHWLFGRRRYDAGHRRRVAEPIRWGRPILVLVLALVLAVLCAPPSRNLIGRAVADVRDRVADRVPVTPVGARASSSTTGAGPEHVLDGAANLYWAPAGTPTGAWVEVDFGQPIRLLDIIITSGASHDRQQFLAKGRPRELAVAVSARSGVVQRKTLALKDGPGGQTFGLKASDVVRIRFTVTSTYGTGPGRPCALAELEFFARG